MGFDEELKRRAEAEGDGVPEGFSRRVRETLDNLPSRPSHRGTWRHLLGAGLAAAVAVTVALPNTSAAMAETLGALPVVGELFQAVTFRTYSVEEGKNHVSIDVPQILDETDSAGAEAINDQVETYTDQLIAEFESQAQADGYFNLDVTWAVVTNTEHWFTLRISTDCVMASGNHQEQHYHIDVATGEQKTLSDLFPSDYDYVTAISDELKVQMAQRMADNPGESYWLEGVNELGTWYFDAIDPEQDFYFNGDGKIVIPFDKYEVGPGTTGSPEFTLENPDLYEHLLYRP
ncbi:DUF3298 domain-containing protein [Candidatus Avoscillospira sp. LCP25S3_F1]|uniref:DUF3298 and DUF4163 domain-containing protein n=1 Tax=Candidatus Avoscillospira sp. LCP25S3_F1 TaxID=3438825 RepID=UPI003F93ED5A